MTADASSDDGRSGAGPGPAIDHRMTRARQAQPSWAQRPLTERLRRIRALRHRIAESADALAATVNATHPRGPGDTLAAEVLPLAEACRFLERNARRILKPRRSRNRFLPLWLMGTSLEVRRDPLGVILIIAPSNYPLMLPGVQAVQALAAGNAVVVKPGRTGMEPMRQLAGLMADAGIPEGLVAVLDESPESGRAAIAARPDKVVLTGGLPTGRAVLASLAGGVTPSVMELSGCDAVFVMPGADLDLAARSVAWGLRINGGATCLAPHRVFVWRGEAEAFRDRLLKVLGAVEACPVDAPIAQRAAQAVAQAEDAGARRLAGGVDLAANAIRPVVLDGVSPSMDVMTNDLFAPVISLTAVDDDTEALRLDACCPFALGASVFGPEAAALALARRIDAGCVTVNDVIASTAHPALPFGGRRLSGFGVTSGAEGLLEMTAIKAIAVKRGRFRPQLDPPSARQEGFLRNYLMAAHGGTIRKRLAALMRTMKQ